MRFAAGQYNAWNDDTKAAKLPFRLGGETVAVWLELKEAEQGNYEIAKKKTV